jgi:hypothetical protein
VAAARVLLSVPVIVNAAMPSNGLLLEKRSVLSAYSVLELANPLHQHRTRPNTPQTNMQLYP